MSSEKAKDAAIDKGFNRMATVLACRMKVLVNSFSAIMPKPLLTRLADTFYPTFSCGLNPTISGQYFYRSWYFFFDGKRWVRYGSVKISSMSYWKRECISSELLYFSSN